MEQNGAECKETQEKDVGHAGIFQAAGHVIGQGQCGGTKDALLHRGQQRHHDDGDVQHPDFQGGAQQGGDGQGDDTRHHRHDAHDRHRGGADIHLGRDGGNKGGGCAHRNVDVAGGKDEHRAAGDGGHHQGLVHHHAQIAQVAEPPAGQNAEQEDQQHQNDR